MSNLTKQWGPTIKRAAPKSTFRIIVDRWGLTSSEDNPEMGIVGGPGDIQITKKDGTEYPNLKAVMAAMTRNGAPKDPSAWFVFRGHPGLLKCEWMGHVNGKPFTDRDHDAWEAGQIKGYAWIMDVWVRFVREYTPTTSEMTKVLGLRED